MLYIHYWFGDRRTEYQQDTDDRRAGEMRQEHNAPILAKIKAWLFAGNDRATANAAILYSLIASAERHGLDPQAYLTGILANIATTPITQLDQFLPDVWKRDQVAENVSIPTH